MHLHTWQDDGWPLNKDGSCCVPYFWRIFFHGAHNRGLSDLLERWIRKPHPRNKSSNGSYSLALGRDTKPGHHALVRPDSRRENLIFCTIHNFIHGTSIVLLVWRSIMFTGSFLRVCRILQFVKKIRFCLLESVRTKPWCPVLVSRPCAKAKEPLVRSRGQWQEIEGLLFNPKNSQLVHILSFCS